MTLEQKVDKMLMYLENDEATNQKGYIERTRDLERSVADLFDIIGKVKVQAIAVAATVSVVFYILKSIFFHS